MLLGTSPAEGIVVLMTDHCASAPEAGEWIQTRMGTLYMIANDWCSPPSLHYMRLELSDV